MLDKTKLCIMACIAACISLLLCACKIDPQEQNATEFEYTGQVAYCLYVENFEWGPAFTKMIVSFDDVVNLDGVDSDSFVVKASGAERTILNVYASDENGNAVEGESNTVTLQMRTGYNKVSLSALEGSSAFDVTDEYYVMKDGGYTLSLAEGKTITIGGISYNKLEVTKSDYVKRISPETDSLNKNIYSGVSGDFYWGAYETEAMKEDGGRNPLIIWLHGSRYGGSHNVDVSIVGFGATHLYTDEIQRYFCDDVLRGAYVLAVQSPQAAWTSDNTQDLMNAIVSYIERNGDIDMERIYIGGCSNGGWMTLNMALNYADLFAAIFPACAAYPSENLSDSELERIKDLPIWFVHSQDDPLVSSVSTTDAIYCRLIRMGAENVYYSRLSSITSEDGSITYYGHMAQIPVMQNRCQTTLDAKQIVDAECLEAAIAALPEIPAVPVTLGTGNVTLMEWLSSQSNLSQ